jgi:hypothetical protein
MAGPGWDLMRTSPNVGPCVARVRLEQSPGRRRSFSGVVDSTRSADRTSARCAVYRQPLGLADRLDALSEVSHQHPSVGAASLLILLLDSAPAVGKAFMSIGKPTLYEQLQDNEETAMLDRARARCRADMAAQEHEAATIVDEAEIQPKLWKQALEDLVGAMVETQRDVPHRYIEQWADDALAGAQEWVDRTRDPAPAADADQPAVPERRRVVATNSRNGSGPPLDLDRLG